MQNPHRAAVVTVWAFTVFVGCSVLVFTKSAFAALVDPELPQREYTRLVVQRFLFDGTVGDFVATVVLLAIMIGSGSCAGWSFCVYTWEWPAPASPKRTYSSLGLCGALTITAYLAWFVYG